MSDRLIVGKVNPRCEICGHRGTSVVLRQRLDPKNFRPTVKRVCGKNDRKHEGWVKVRFDRAGVQ